jgi:hypothetical protein
LVKSFFMGAILAKVQSARRAQSIVAVGERSPLGLRAALQAGLPRAIRRCARRALFQAFALSLENESSPAPGGRKAFHQLSVYY